MQTFNRARGFGMLVLLAIAVAAAGLSYWLQSHYLTFVTARDSSAGTSILRVSVFTGLQFTTTTSAITAPDGTVTAQDPVNVDWYKAATDANSCDVDCQRIHIAGIVQVTGVAIGLATWTLWLVLTAFGKLKHGVWACAGIWIMSLAEAASVALYVSVTYTWFQKELAAIPGFKITNIYSLYGPSFALSCFSIGWCWIIIGAYLHNLRLASKINSARNAIGPLHASAPESDQIKGHVAKSAAWVV